MQREQLVGAQLRVFTLMLHGVDAGEARAVHRTRIASRRLRELVPVLQLEGSTAGKLVRRLRTVRRRLGPLRDVDVLLQRVDELRRSGRHSARALLRVSQELKRERRTVLGQLNRRSAHPEIRRVARSFAKIGDRLAERPATSDRTQPWRWALDARVVRCATMLRHAVTDAGSMYSVDRLHGIRIALKKLRYSLELAVVATGRSLRADLKTLERVQAVLGRMHDLERLIDRIRALQASLVRPDLTLWRELDGMVNALETDCRRAHARYLHGRDALLAMCHRLAAKAPAVPRRLSSRRRAG